MAVDTLRAALAWGVGSNVPVALTIVHAKYLDAPTFTIERAQDLIDSIATGLTNVGTSNLHPSGFRFVGARVSQTDPFPESIYLTPTGGSVSLGSGTTDPLPGGVALVVTLRSINLSRKGTGRSYMPFWNETANASNGGPGSVAQDRAVALREAIGNGILSALGTPIDAVYSRGADISYPIQSYQMRDGLWDRQWRRTSRATIEP